MTQPGQSNTEARLYRVNVIDRRTMEALSHGVSVIATCDIEASDAIRERYPRKHFILVDRMTGAEVDL